MSDLSVRGLAQRVLKRLKHRAKERRRPLQSEVREILEEAARRDEDREEAIAFFDRMRNELRDIPQTDSTEVIREARDSR